MAIFFLIQIYSQVMMRNKSIFSNQKPIYSKISFSSPFLCKTMELTTVHVKASSGDSQPAIEQTLTQPRVKI
jgi:hypothetical protein